MLDLLAARPQRIARWDAFAHNDAEWVCCGKPSRRRAASTELIFLGICTCVYATQNQWRMLADEASKESEHSDVTSLYFQSFPPFSSPEG